MTNNRRIDSGSSYGHYSSLVIKENNPSTREKQTCKLLSRNANSVWLIPFERYMSHY